MTTAELEWRLVYAVVVAGKSATFANAAVERLRAALPSQGRPIALLAAALRCGSGVLESARTGRYRVLKAAIAELDRRAAWLDLRACTPAELEAIPGVGPKTARFFVAWTRPGARVAVLDRHVLRWMRSIGYDEAPDDTPRGAAYRDLERAFLEEADRRGRTPRELDLEIWSAAATAPNVV